MKSDILRLTCVFFDRKEKRMLKKIAVTGGPCAGKSDFRKFIAAELEKSGLKPLFTPEVATIHLESGIKLEDAISTADKVFKFEGEVLRMQLFFEAHWTRVAEELGYDVIFFDRGISDINTYMDDPAYAELLKTEGLIAQDIHTRYDGVLYLVSAADGVPEHYSCANNPSRYEKTIELALETEIKTRHAWLGQPRLAVIRNVYNGKKITFEEKMARATEAVVDILAAPMRNFERKFLVGIDVDPRNFPEEIKKSLTRISPQTYLKSKDGAVRRIRDSWFDGAPRPIHLYTEKRRLPNGVAEIHERPISEDEDRNLLTEADLEAFPVVKLRWSFFWQGQYFHFDWITRPQFVNILEVHPSRPDDLIEFPPFIGEVVEVTGRADFTNEVIARGKCPCYQNK